MIDGNPAGSDRGNEGIDRRVAELEELLAAERTRYVLEQRNAAAELASLRERVIEVERLRSQLSDLQRERDRLRKERDRYKATADRVTGSLPYRAMNAMSWRLRKASRVIRSAVGRR